MKLIIKHFLFNAVVLALLAVTAPGCTRDYADMNRDQTAIATVGEAQLPFLFSGAIAATPWGDQVAENLFSSQYAQYFANNATYFPSDRYTMVSEWVQNNFDPVYTRIVP